MLMPMLILKEVCCQMNKNKICFGWNSLLQGRLVANSEVALPNIKCISLGEVPTQVIYAIFMRTGRFPPSVFTTTSLQMAGIILLRRHMDGTLHGEFALAGRILVTLRSCQR
mmetsp:Transcript_54230/g.121930  ORF Transcript_54230/g.121930 Transcript_54230/m.121930 type:complete len:112 (-) Transcript_54230:8-343(-)